MAAIAKTLAAFGLSGIAWAACLSEATKADGPLPIVHNSIGMALVKVPAGEFLMGGQEDEARLIADFPEMKREPGYFAGEYPQHRVRISHDLLVGQFEVKFGEFRQFVEATGYRT